MALQFTSIALALKLKLPPEALERHLAASPEIVTHELVTQILQYEQQHKLGYFAALEFYQDNVAIEPDLFAAVSNINWVVTNMVRNEIRIKLRPAFSNVRFESIQILANTLPGVRCNAANVQEQLLEHFDLGTVKVNLKATLIQKIQDHEAAQRIAKNLAYQWLKASFKQVDVTSSKVISN